MIHSYAEFYPSFLISFHISSFFRFLSFLTILVLKLLLYLYFLARYISISKPETSMHTSCFYHLYFFECFLCIDVFSYVDNIFVSVLDVHGWVLVQLMTHLLLTGGVFFFSPGVPNVHLFMFSTGIQLARKDLEVLFQATLGTHL